MSGVWASVWITLGIQILAALVVYVPPVLAPVAQADVGVAANSVGIVTALIFASATFGALVSGAPIARYGPLRISQASLLLCAGGLAVMTTGNVWLIALGALVVGVGYGPVTPSSSAILSDRAPARRRAFIFSLKQTGVPVGGALAGALLPAVMLLFGWRGAALASAGVCVLLAIGLEPLRRHIDKLHERPHPEPRAPLGDALRLVMGHRELRQLALASFTYSGMQNCLGSFLVVYLHERVGFSVHAAGLVLSAAMLAGIVGRIVWGLVADHWVPPRRLLALLGLAMSAGAFATAMFAPAWPVAAVVAVSLLFGVTAVGWNGVYIAEVARIAPAKNAGTATGAALAMSYAGVVAMPLLFWIIVRATESYGIAYAVAACLTLWRCSRLFARVADPAPA